MGQKILVLFDAGAPTAYDQDFSEELKTADWQTEADVLKALETLGYSFAALGVYNDLSVISRKIQEFQPDLIFNLVESYNGLLHHDRDVASYLKLLGIPFSGCGPTGMTLCKDKGLSKQILSYHRLSIPNFAVISRKKKIFRPRKLSFPILIKPLSEEASYGISQASFIETDQDFIERVEFIHRMDQDAIAEEYIQGRELYVSVIGNQKLEVFPLRELVFSQVPEDEPRIATFKAKWDEEYRKRWGIRNQFAAPLPNGSREKIEKLAKKIYRLLKITGYARIDLRLTPEGRIVFLEANPNPILAKEEDFAESAAKAGLDYPHLLERILKLSTLHTED